MELTFLGRGAAFFVEEGNTAAYLREGDRLLLVDCGETVFGRLKQLRLLDGVREVTVLLSHLHTDHCGSLSSLALYCRYALTGVDFRVALPDDEVYREQVKTLLTLTGCDQNSFRLIADADVVGFAGFTRVKYLPTEHAPGMRCFSFAFDTPRGAVFYSADTKNTDTLAAFWRGAENVDRIYMDASDTQGGVHPSLEELCRAIPPEMREKTFLMHFNHPECIAKSKAQGFKTVKTYSDS